MVNHLVKILLSVPNGLLEYFFLVYTMVSSRGNLMNKSFFAPLKDLSDNKMQEPFDPNGIAVSTSQGYWL